jgi:hypothetical protein
MSTLVYFDVNAKTQVIADASPVGFGAVLVQKQGEDYKIICYASRSLSDIERRYSQTVVLSSLNDSMARLTLPN